MKGDEITLQVSNFFKYKKIFCQGLSPLQNNQFQIFFVPFFEMTSALFEKIVAMYRFYFHDFFFGFKSKPESKVIFFSIRFGFDSYTSVSPP